MRQYAVFLLVLVLGVGCTSINEQKEFDPNEFEKVELKYAKHFRLKRKGDRFLLELLDAESKKVDQSVLISQKSNQRVICLTATLTGMFCALDQRDYLIGITSGDQLYDASLRKKYAEGSIKEYGDFAQLSMERVANDKPDVVLYNFVNNDFPHKEKLERLGVKFLIINDWLEAHPLAKAEWIKVIGAMTGKYDEACDLFGNIESDYLSIKQNVDSVSQKPTVISGNLIGGNWYAPSGENYFGILIRDAGANYRYKNTTGTRSLSLSLEKVLEDNQNTSIWLNPGVATREELEQMNPHASLLQASKNGVYCYSGNTNKFWEESALYADKMLADLVHIFHPELDPDYQFEYYAPLQP